MKKVSWAVAFVLWLPVCLIFGVLPANGQVEGSITGTVVSEQGAPVPDAVISLSRSGDKTPLFSANSGSDGSFTIHSLYPVTYGVSIASKAGSLALTEVKVRPGQPTTLRNLVLKPDIKEDARQLADASQRSGSRAEEGVQTTDTQIASTLEIPQLELLPQSLRDPLQLLDTQAGVFTNNGASTINGLRPSLINVTIDGVNAQDSPNRAGTLNYLPTRPFLDQVSEFTLVTSNASSRFGSGAAQVAFATPSGLSRSVGANDGQRDLHGDLFFLFSPAATNANDWFTSASGVKADFTRYQGGASVGGSLIRHRLFFYGNYELLRYKDEYPFRYYSLTQKAIDSIPDSQSIFKSAVKLFDQPTTLFKDANGQTLDFGSYTKVRPQEQNLNNLTGKVDLFLPSKGAISFSYLLSNDQSDPLTANALFNTAILNSTPLRSDDFRHLGAVSWRTSKVRWDNKLQAGVSDLPVVFAPIGAFPALAISVGFKNAGTRFIGQSCSLASCDSAQTLGPTANPLASVPPYLNDNITPGSARSSRTYMFGDNAAWNRSRQTLQFGFHFQRVETAFQNKYSQLRSGYTEFGDIPNCSGLCKTAIGGANLGYPAVDYQIQRSGAGFVVGPITGSRYRQNSLSFYGQDTLRVGRRLTTILGLRYEFNPAPNESNGNFLAPNLANQNIVSALLNPATEFRFTSDGVYGARHDFAPNVGVAFDPTGKGTTVLRAGYSISYSTDGVMDALNANQPGGESDGNRYVPMEGQPFETVQSVPPINTVQFQGPLTIPVLQSLLASRRSGYFKVVSSGGVNPNLRTPYVQQWNFDIQHSWKSTVFDVRYVGNHGVGLLRQLNINQVDVNGKDSNGNSFLNDFLSYDPNGLSTGTTFARNCAGQASFINPLLTYDDITQKRDPCQNYIDSRGVTQLGLRGLGYAGEAAAGYGTGYQIYRNNAATQGVNLLGNFSHSSFHALQIDINRRFANGFQFQANYSFAKVLSDSANATTGSDSALTKVEYLRDANRPRLDYGPALFDIRHSIKFNFYYLLPSPNRISSGFGKAVLGGWSVSGIVVRQSGTPFSLYGSGVFTSTFVGDRRSIPATADAKSDIGSLFDIRKTPNGVYFIASSALDTKGNPSVHTARISYLNGTGFGIGSNKSILNNPSPGQIGTLQPRSFYNPWGTQVNLGVQKMNRITEQQSLQIRVEAVNLFNHASFYVPDGANGGDINNAGFGRVQSTLYPARKMQFTVLYRF